MLTVFKRWIAGTPQQDPGGSGGDEVFTICLAPDRFHLRHVGQTRQGNGYWVTSQLASEAGGTRDFIVGYLFDQSGEMIAADVVDLGLRNGGYKGTPAGQIETMLKKLEAAKRTAIRVQPFSCEFYGHRFGLIPREGETDMRVDAMPGHTLMFYGPWDRCNYDS